MLKKKITEVLKPSNKVSKKMNELCMSVLSCCNKTPERSKPCGEIYFGSWFWSVVDSQAELTVGACGLGLLHRAVSEVEGLEQKHGQTVTQRPPGSEPPLPSRLYKLPERH